VEPAAQTGAHDDVELPDAGPSLTEAPPLPAPAMDPCFLALAETLPELVSLHSPEEGCVYASAAAQHLLGADPVDLVGRDWAELVPAEDYNPFAPGDRARVSHRLLRPYGPPLVAETMVTPVERDGEGLQLLCVTRGLDAGGWELPDSLHDRLDGLATRAALLDRLGSLLALGQDAIAAIVIDLDHLAAVNERFGKDAGERVLAETARRLQSMLRPADMLGRLEDDGLCALCLGVSDYRAALRIAERIREVVARPLPFEPVMATASVGAALATSAPDAETVLANAAEAANGVRLRGGNAASLHGGG
jgi:diguanylate cyclase (GGDEF)-like protein